MSPPRGGDSWKWSETENQSKPVASANFHSLRISSSGPPMWPIWPPKVIAIDSAPRGRRRPWPPARRCASCAPPGWPRRREVVHLDLERHAVLTRPQAGEQGSAHGGVGEAVDHASSSANGPSGPALPAT